MYFYVDVHERNTSEKGQRGVLNAMADSAWCWWCFTVLTVAHDRNLFHNDAAINLSGIANPNNYNEIQLRLSFLPNVNEMKERKHKEKKPK